MVQILRQTALRALASGMMLGCALAIPFPAARAQEIALLTPKAVASEFLNAVTAGDWPTVVRLTDDTSLWEYATWLRRNYGNWRDHAPEKPTVEAFLQRDSLMPRAVAEYYVSQFERSYRNSIPELLGVLADVERTTQLDSLNDGELYVRRLRAKQVSYQGTLANRRAGCTGQAESTITAEPARRVRGVAMLSETEAIALYEEKDGVLDSPRIWGGLAQLALRRTKLGWRVTASESLLTGGEMAIFTSVTDCRSR